MKVIDYFNLPQKEESNLEKKIKKAASLALVSSLVFPASMGLLNQNAYANSKETGKQEQKISKEEQKKKPGVSTQKKDYTIYTLDVWVGEDEHLRLKHGDSIEVPFDKTTIYIKPQSKNGLITETMLKHSEKNINLNDKYHTDNKGYIMHSTGPLSGQRVIIRNERFDLAEYGIMSEEEILAEPTYETKTKLLQTVQIKIRRGPEPIKEPEIKEWPSRLTGKEGDKGEKTGKGQKGRHSKEVRKGTKISSVYEIKALFIGGSEPPVTKCDIEKNFSGFLVQGAYYQPNLRAWATIMNIGYDRRLKDDFTQGTVGVDLALGPLVGEVEGIITSNSYKGGFASGGLRFPFGKKGYTSPVFVQATYGVGFGEGNRSDHPGDEPVHQHIKETNFISVHVKSPFIEGHYSQSTYDNDLKTLNGSRNSLGLTVMLPLSKISKNLEGLSLTGYYGTSTINEACLKDFEIERYGVGITFRK